MNIRSLDRFSICSLERLRVDETSVRYRVPCGTSECGRGPRVMHDHVYLSYLLVYNTTVHY